MPNRRRLDRDILGEIEAKVLEGWRPSQIHTSLSREGRYRSRVPSLRTVQRMVAELKGPDDSSAWSLSHADDGGDARLILEALAAVVINSKGLKLTLSQAEATWVLRIRRAAPGLGPWRAWILTTLYMGRERRGVSDTTDLDSFLAFAPWRPGEAYERYRAAVDRGWIAELPMWDLIRPANFVTHPGTDPDEWYLVPVEGKPESKPL